MVSCIICDKPHAVVLQCSHAMCVECILNVFDGYESTLCPVCRQCINMDAIIQVNPCARCKKCQSEYCQSCGNFLCDECWNVIHSFKPLNSHSKHFYSVDPNLRKNVLSKLESDLDDLKQIEMDLGNLNNDGNHHLLKPLP